MNFFCFDELHGLFLLMHVDFPRVQVCPPLSREGASPFATQPQACPCFRREPAKRKRADSDPTTTVRSFFVQDRHAYFTLFIFFCFSFGVAARACRQRAKALTEAKSLFSDKRYAEARKKLLQSLSRTQRVQEALLRALDAAEIPVQYIVAPYEADSQLAWMVRTGYLDCVLSQDTDLIPLGCPLVSETVRCLSLISRLIEMLTLVPCMRTHDFVRALQPSAGPFQDGLEVR